HADLIPVARKLAQRIVRHSPLAVGAVITAVTRGLNMAISEGLLVESEQFASLVPTHDLAEGLAAWKARRAPHYRGARDSGSIDPGSQQPALPGRPPSLIISPCYPA